MRWLKGRDMLSDLRDQIDFIEGGEGTIRGVCGTQRGGIGRSVEGGMGWMRGGAVFGLKGA